MQYAFDLDGTLADTREAVLGAYREAGVEPPLGFFGMSWREWLNDERVHHEKNRLYVNKYVREVKASPIAQMALDLQKLGSVGNYVILTAASIAATQAVVRKVGLSPLSMYCELNADAKISMLNSMALGSQGPGIYFDDNQQMIDKVMKETKWATCLVRFR